MFSFCFPITNEANKCLKTSLKSSSQGLRWQVSCERKKIFYSSSFTCCSSPDKKAKLYRVAEKGNKNHNNADWGVEAGGAAPGPPCNWCLMYENRCYECEPTPSPSCLFRCIRHVDVYPWISNFGGKMKHMYPLDRLKCVYWVWFAKPAG